MARFDFKYLYIVFPAAWFSSPMNPCVLFSIMRIQMDLVVRQMIGGIRSQQAKLSAKQGKIDLRKRKDGNNPASQPVCQARIKIQLPTLTFCRIFARSAKM